MANNKLELTWIGKEIRPKLELRILLEDPDKSCHALYRVTDNDIFDNRLIFGDNLLRHGKRLRFIEMEGALGNEHEEEANEFARDWLVPPHYTQSLAAMEKTEVTIRVLADQLGIAPGIIVGRLQNEGPSISRLLHHNDRGLFQIAVRHKYDAHSPPGKGGQHGAEFFEGEVLVVYPSDDYLIEGCFAWFFMRGILSLPVFVHVLPRSPAGSAGIGMRRCLGFRRRFENGVPFRLEEGEVGHSNPF